MSFNECKWRKQSKISIYREYFAPYHETARFQSKPRLGMSTIIFFNCGLTPLSLKRIFLCLHKIWTIYFLIHKLLCSYQIDVYCYFRYAHRETTPSITKIECEYRNFQCSNDTHGQEVKMILIDFREKFLVLQNEPLLVMFSFYDLASALGSIFSCLVIFSLPRV